MYRSKWVLLTVFVLNAFFGATSLGQESNEPDIWKRLEMIKNGQADEVKKELPSLLTRYQHHPGVLYLQGLLTSDGTEAVKIFQSVVDNFPMSDWADDALFKIYQYYYSIGLYKTAAQKYERLKKDYPTTPYLAHGEPRGMARTADDGEKVKPSPSSEGGTFAVQVGAFSTAENANRQKNFFRNSGKPVEILNKVKSGKSFYLVWMGNFKNYEEARKFRSELKSRYNIEPIVVER